MKPLRLLGAAALALAAGAPTGALVAQGTPSPENWWQLDAGQDRYPGISVVRAYNEILAGKTPKRTVVVAIIDSGIDVEHPDLDGNIWVNEDEVAGNGRDDDNNGYVDDVHGWNFIGGKDGRHVHFDTYEITRIYARLRKVCEGGGTRPAECAEYPAVKRSFETKRNETAQILSQYRMIDQMMAPSVKVLKAHLGTEELTPEKVEAIRTPRTDVMQARGQYLGLAEQGVTPDQISAGIEELQGLVQYGFNPDFEPRDIVGDNYADLRERGYGNAIVEGPAADHGTHVAGIVGAERGNGLGMDGVAPAVKIMVIRAVPQGDERDKDVANAIRYAVDNGAQVINMSFGKGYSPHKEAVDDAVRYADSKGVLMVHAAGNDGADLGTEPNFPNRDYLAGGQAKNWIEVGASSWSGMDALAATFSNYGRQRVDVFAPGVAIYSTVPDEKYERNDGTSMAAPVVSGLAALVMAYYPELSATEVRQVILESATRYADQQVTLPGGESRVAFGTLSATGAVVNAHAALQLAEQKARAKRN